jgi:transmembrane sensor
MPKKRALTLEREALYLITDALAEKDAARHLRALDAWRRQSVEHAVAYERAVTIHEALNAAARRAHKRGRTFGSPGAIRTGRRVFIIGSAAVAASAVGLALYPPLGLWPSAADLLADHHTGPGEQRAVAMLSGASLTLNTRTRVDVRAQQNGVARIALRDGEVAVSAATGIIVVEASAGETRVSSGETAIRRLDGLVRVACLSGKAVVTCGEDTVTLAANERVEYARRFVRAIPDAARAADAAWLNGLLIFQDETLAAAIAEINRYRAGKIILANAELAARRITARVEIARLGEIVAYLETVFGAKAERWPASIVVLR